MEGYFIDRNTTGKYTEKGKPPGLPFSVFTSSYQD